MAYFCLPLQNFTILQITSSSLKESHSHQPRLVFFSLPWVLLSLSLWLLAILISLNSKVTFSGRFLLLLFLLHLSAPIRKYCTQTSTMLRQDYFRSTLDKNKIRQNIKKQKKTKKNSLFRMLWFTCLPIPPFWAVGSRKKWGGGGILLK